jgi:hypothetical protein
MFCLGPNPRKKRTGDAHTVGCDSPKCQAIAHSPGLVPPVVLINSRSISQNDWGHHMRVQTIYDLFGTRALSACQLSAVAEMHVGERL